MCNSHTTSIYSSFLTTKSVAHMHQLISYSNSSLLATKSVAHMPKEFSPLTTKSVAYIPLKLTYHTQTYMHTHTIFLIDKDHISKELFLFIVKLFNIVSSRDYYSSVHERNVNRVTLYTLI